MTFLQFVAFATVARQSSITKAAHELHTSQPSLSKQLKLLEETYKTKLFISNSKGIELTDDGVEFLKHIEPILEQLQVLQAHFKEKVQKKPTTLMIGGSYSLSANFIPSVLRTFNKRFPDIEVVLRSNLTSTLERMLIKGAVELLFTTVKPESPELTMESCMRLKLIAFAAKGYRLPHGEMTLKQIEKVPLIIRDGETQKGTTEMLLKEMQKQHYKQRIILRCETPDALIMAVRKKMGIGIIYEDVVKEEIARGLFKRVAISGLPSESMSYVVYHKECHLSESANAFLAIVRDHCSLHKADVRANRALEQCNVPGGLLEHRESL